MACRPKTRGLLHMTGLVIKKEIGLIFFEKRPLPKATKEHRFIDSNAPGHECADCTFVSGSTARGHERGANAHRCIATGFT